MARQRAAFTEAAAAEIDRLSGVREQLSARIAQRPIATARQLVGTMKRGQALIWAANLLHGGDPIGDPQSTRYSQVTHHYSHIDEGEKQAAAMRAYEVGCDRGAENREPRCYAGFSS